MKFGLALGSGGARGFAHIGVIKELIKNKIKIDSVAGSSAGAIVGAYFALNLEIDGLEKKVKKMKYSDFLKLLDAKKITNGFIHGKKFMKFIEEILGNKKFSDCKIPLAIVTTDLSTGKQRIIKQGSILKAIRASISVPGIFEVIPYDGEYLIDGGTVNPTPVDVCKMLKSKAVIGVDLTMQQKTKIQNPNIITILLKSFEVLRSRVASLTALDKNTIIIQPTSASFLKSFKFSNINNFIRSGERNTKKQIPEILKLGKKVFKKKTKK